MSESQDLKKLCIEIPTELDECVENVIEIIDSDFGIKINKNDFIIKAIENEFEKAILASTKPHNMRWKAEQDAKKVEEDVKEEFMKYKA